jgi:hypothetical protein
MYGTKDSRGTYAYVHAPAWRMMMNVELSANVPDSLDDKFHTLLSV